MKGTPPTSSSSYLTILHFLLAIFMAAFSIYWMSITSSSIWLKAIGGNIFTVNFFLFLMSVGSTAKLAATFLTLSETIEYLVKSVSVIAMLLAITLGCISVSLATNKMADRYYHELKDYVLANRLRQEVKEFEGGYPTYRSQSEYIHKRTTNASSIMVGLCSCWTGVCLLNVLILVRDFKTDAGDDKAALIPPSDL
jgi:hypothetical protein